jgi:hypothetical protein
MLLRQSARNGEWDAQEAVWKINTCQHRAGFAIVRPLAEQRMPMQSEAGKKKVDETR